jgi:hypothetical protein
VDVTEIKRIITPVLRRYGVVRAGIFGSVARGEATAGSDVDVLVDFEGRKSLLDLVSLRAELSALLGRHADVLTYASLNHRLKSRILAEEVRIL